MFKRELYLVFGLVFVCVGAQQRPVRPPKPPRVSGSYSDYPGLLVNKNPIQTKRQENVQNNVLPVLPQNVPKEPSPSSFSRINSGPIVIPAASSSYGSFPSQGSPQAAPPQASSFSGLPKSAQGIPVSVVAAAELTQQYEKPTAPLKTGTDTWTPMGFTGDGKTFDMTSTARPSPDVNKPGKSSPVVTPQPVPYDPTKSKQTIGQQIIERQQQQQQQPQQYDIFGFPIDNSPDPFANLFGMAPSNGGLFGPMFYSSPDPFFGSFGGAVTGSNQGIAGGSSQSGLFGNNMLQMMLMMQMLGDAPDPQPRGRGRRGPGATSSSPLSGLEQLLRMEEIRMRRQRQQELVNRNRRRPENQRRPSQRQGPTQQTRYTPVIDTVPRIPKPSPTRSAVVLYPGSAPRRRAPVRQSLHPAVLDRRNMPTTPAPATQGQEPVEREGPAAAAPKAPKQPSFRQYAIERHSIRRNYAQGGTAPQYRDHTMQYNQASQMPYNEPPMSYNDPAPSMNANFGQSYNAHQDLFFGGFQQQQQQISQLPTQPQLQPNQQQSYQQQPYANPMATRNAQQPSGNAVPRNIQQLVNNPLFQRRLRTAGATPGANPADVRADRADRMADRADNLQAISPFQRMIGMALAAGRGGPSPASLSPNTNTFGSSGSAGTPFGLGISGTSQSEIKQSHDPLEVIVNTIEMQIDQSRHRRHAVRGDLNGIAEPIKKFYPPKPPKDLPMPAPRRRPPPPPPLQEEMFKNQQETVQPKTKSQPRYSGVSKAPSKKVDTKPAKPSPVTTTTTTTTAKPPPSTPVTKTKSKPVPKAKKVITSKTKGTPKLPLKPNKTEKSKAKPYMKSEAVNHEQNAVNALEAGESPKEALNAEANLELQALIGSSNAADYHGHAHEHAPHDHSHGHTHTHAHPESQTQKPANRNNGPPAEMQAKFSSMFNAWYNAKFGDVQSPPTEATTAQPKYVTAKSKQTKQPSTVYTPKKRPGPVTKSVDKNALFKEFMTMFQSQLKIDEKAKSATNYQAKVTTKPVKTKAITMSPITTTKVATTTPTTKAPQTKAYVSNSKAKETNSKTKASNSKAKATYEKSPTAKFGPRKKNDYMKPTTKPTPNLQTTAAVANDPTQVKLVTLSHPESLAYPSNETSQTATGSNTSMTSPNGGSTPPIQNTEATGMNIDVLTRQEFTGRQKYLTTTIRPTPDPDLLADINEARGLPEVQAHQVDVHGNLLPFYKRQMRIGRLPARPHPIHNPGGLHHQLQHQHDLPHYHPEQGIGAGYNHFPNLFYPQPTNNGAVMAYEPFPRPNSQGPTTAAPITRAAKHLPNTMNVAPIPMVDAGPLNPLAYLYFFNALSNLLQPQNNRGYMAQLYGNGNGQGYNNLFNQNRQNNGMPGSYAFSQLAHRHASGQNQASEHTQASAGSPSSNTNGLVHGDLAGGSHAHSNIDMHHQAIHREAGNALTPDLHRQVHRLLRNRELSRQRGNMFGMGMQNFPAATQTPFIDPDLYADMMEARAAALAG